MNVDDDGGGSGSGSGSGSGNDNGDNNEYNPQDVEDLLSKELLALNVKDRNDIQEEIHGVKCLAIEETPRMISMSLRLLIIELDDDNSNSGTVEEKFAYRLAKQFPYVHTAEFRLKLLRCELFHIPRTARRMIIYLKLMLEYFGIAALRRPLQLADLSKHELRIFRQGRLQFLPFRDRSGRRILSWFPNEDSLMMEKSYKCRIALYLGQVATEHDVETQKKGIVALMWCSSISFSISHNKSTFGMMHSYPSKCTCMRYIAIHVCTPDTPLYRLLRSAITMKWFSTQNRSRMIFHTGTPVELRYKLVGFGLPTENIPVSWTGTLKLLNLRQWMILRRVLEDAERNKMTSQHQLIQTPAGEVSISDIVECPSWNDVLYRQGTAVRNHPGNVRFRSYIETELHTNPGLSVQQLMQKVIQEIIKKRRGRVLVWTVTAKVIPNTVNNNNNNNNNKSALSVASSLASSLSVASASATATASGGGSSHKRTPLAQKLECWCILKDRIQINAKIEYTVRDYIRNNPTVAKYAAITTTTTTTTKRQRQKRNRQNVSSHTNIFQSEESHDDKNGGVGRCCRK